MSDLISRKALLEAFLNLTRSMDKVPEEKIHDLITNAPAVEEGEVAGYVKAERNALNTLDKHGNVCMVMRAYLRGKVNDGDLLYTTPQQPQSVADALEEVISIVWDVLDNPELSGHGYCNDLEGRIRALIKRNAVKEGE